MSTKTNETMCPLHGDYNPQTSRFYNRNTGKWVIRLRPSAKGNAVGKQKGRAIYGKYEAIGFPERTILIPVNLDIAIIKKEADSRSLNYEHCLFIFHKLLHNRIRLRNVLKHDRDYSRNYTPLSSTDLYNWLGKKYVKCLSLLLDLSFLSVKLSSSGRKSYWNGGAVNGKLSMYKIEEKLFNHSLFDHHQQFLTYRLTDPALNIKLYDKKVNRKVKGFKIVEVLSQALQTAKIKPDFKRLSANHLPETIQEMQVLINDINNGDIYIKPELDKYGERFHSIFTFTWSELRPLVYFEGKPSGTTYMDIRNSQYFFFSLLSAEHAYKIVPEFQGIKPFFDEMNADSSFVEFCQQARTGTLYTWCKDRYGFSKPDLMKIFFGSKDQFKTKRKKLRWLKKLIEQIEDKFGSNILPKVLQRLESRTLLDEVCFTFLKRHRSAGLISIHDGVLIETSLANDFKSVLSEVFSRVSFPLPAFKEITYDQVHL